MILLSSLVLIVIFSFTQYIHFLLFKSYQLPEFISVSFFQRDFVPITISLIIILLINFPIIYFILKNKRKLFIFPKLEEPPSKSIYQIYFFSTFILFTIYLSSFFHVYFAAKLFPFGLKYFAKYSIAKYYGYFFQFSRFLSPLIITSSSYLQNCKKYNKNKLLLIFISCFSLVFSIYSSWVFKSKLPFINNLVVILVSFITYNDFSKLNKRKIFQFSLLIITSISTLSFFQLFLRLDDTSSFSAASFSLINRIPGPELLSFLIQKCNFINIFTTTCTDFNAMELSKNIFGASDSTGVAPSLIGYFYIKFSILGFFILILYYTAYMILINIFRPKSNSSINLPFYLGIINLQLLYLLTNVDGNMEEFLTADGSIFILSIFLLFSSKLIPSIK